MSYGRPSHTDVVVIAECQEFLVGELRPIVVVMVFGTLNLWMMSVKNSTACSDLIRLIGRASIHLENLSIATSK